MHTYYTIGYSEDTEAAAKKDAEDVIPAFAEELNVNIDIQTFASEVHDGIVGIAMIQIEDDADLFNDIWSDAFPSALFSRAACDHYFEIMSALGFWGYGDGEVDAGGSAVDTVEDADIPETEDEDIPFQMVANDDLSKMYKKNLRLPFSPKLWGQGNSEALAYDWRRYTHDVPDLDFEFDMEAADTHRMIEKQIHARDMKAEQERHERDEAWRYQNRKMPVGKRSFTRLFPHLAPKSPFDIDD